MIRLITTLIIALLVFVSTAFSQDIFTSNTNFTGNWYGQLEYQGQKSDIGFTISEKEGVYTTTLSSNNQNGIPTKSTNVNNNIIEVDIDIIKASFIGEFKKDKIDGIFKQAGMNFTLVLTKTKPQVKKKTRLQDPKKPYNYRSEDVTFVNAQANNIKLAGTLTLPNNIKNPTVAILITGSGPQNRDSEIFNHRPFLVIADYLTNSGIAVLRVDDRGVAKSEGTQKGKTSADFTTDVEAAVIYLKTRTDINTKKIGLIGHSEGGFIAPMVASKDKSIAFIVSLAGTGVNGSKILLTQARKHNEIMGVTKDVLNYNEKFSSKLHQIAVKNNSITEIKKEIKTHLSNLKNNNIHAYDKFITDAMIEQNIASFNEWTVYFIKTDPAQFLNKVTCPVLALNGSKDFQVLPKLNLNGIKNALKHNKDVTIKELEGLNHLFQKCETGVLNEYAKIEETFNEEALKIVANWINKRF